MTDFTTVTACGESCVECPKKLDGRCPGCIEADGRVPEWAESGRCRVHACARDHQAAFCGLCSEFPCGKLPEMMPWNPGIISRMTALRDEYFSRYPERTKPGFSSRGNVREKEQTSDNPAAGTAGGTGNQEEKQHGTDLEGIV